jgi:superfamily I DNA/RNA helicase
VASSLTRTLNFRLLVNRSKSDENGDLEHEAFKETFADSLRAHLDIAEARFQSAVSDGGENGDEAAKLERPSDNVEIILACLDCVEDGDDFIERLRSEVRKTLVDRRDSSLVLSTIHKAKGIEWERVFVVGLEKYIPSKYATREWQLQQENNMAYVAVTRAKS